MEPKINKKRRILILITQSELGGAQQFLLQLVSHIDRTRFEIALATGSDGSNEILSLIKPYAQVITLKSLKRRPSIVSDINSLFEIRELIGSWQPDVLFLNSSKAGFNGALATVFPSTLRPLPKVIYRIGGWTFNDPWPLHKKLAYFLLEYMSASWKDIIILNNRHDFEQAQRYHIKPRGSLELIHNGIDASELKFLDKQEARYKLLSSQKINPGSDSEVWLGTIANFYPTKGLTYLIEAIAHTKGNYKLLIIGDGQQRAKLEALIAKHQLQDKVFLVGKHDRASQYLRAFDVFILPSVKEGFPWAVLEAMTAKVPVIATSVGAIPEVLKDGVNGLIVAPADSSALSKAIASLVSNQKFREQFGQEGYKTVQENFTLKNMVAKFEEIFS